MHDTSHTLRMRRYESTAELPAKKKTNPSIHFLGREANRARRQEGEHRSPSPSAQLHPGRGAAAGGRAGDEAAHTSAGPGCCVFVLKGACIRARRWEAGCKPAARTLVCSADWCSSCQGCVLCGLAAAELCTHICKYIKSMVCRGRREPSACNCLHGSVTFGERSLCALY